LPLFLQAGHLKHYPAKATIVREGDESTSLYYILSGSVSVSVVDAQGHEIVLSYLNSGEFFGELGLFERAGRRSANVVARTECALAEVEYNAFRRIAARAAELVWMLAAQLAARLRKTNAKVRSLAFVDTAGRVSHTLLELAREPHAKAHPQGMQIRITRQEIARIVGCSREMVGRVLKEFEARGLISVRGRIIVILSCAPSN
jgi:CRP/FNR family cyclic AMP-dependent transcriptional regulator